MRHSLFMSAPLLAMLSACSPSNPETSVTQVDQPQALDQAQIAQFAQSVGVEYRLLSNKSDDNCDKSQTDGLCYQARITFSPKQDFTHTDWKIFLSQTSPIQSDSSNEFDIVHVNGDLHYISPTADFKGFSAGKEYQLDFRAGFWQLSESDQMPNYYIVVDNFSPEVLASTKTSTDPDTGAETRPFVIEYEDQAQITRSPVDSTLWATPAKLFEQAANDSAEIATTGKILPSPLSQRIDHAKAALNLAGGIQVHYSGDVSDLTAPLHYLSRLGVELNSEGSAINLQLDPNLDMTAEGYELKVSAQGVDINANDRAGLLYGLYSLASALDLDTLSVAQMQVSDAPRYGFRGMHVDVSRNFHSKAFVLRLLDQMAAAKLNKLHLHLADDEGWRIEIEGLPELTEIGAYRCHTGSEQQCLIPQLGSGPHRDAPVNGYYTKQDYIDIVRAAQARNIQVIPSLDMPGHARAAVVAMQARYSKYIARDERQKAQQYLLTDFDDTTQYSSVQFYHDNTINVCMDSSYAFIDKVLDEMSALHEQAGQALSLYHIGADETAGAWVESPVCQQFMAEHGVAETKHLSAYFVERVANMLAQKGIAAAAWSDGLDHVDPAKMPANVQSNAWGALAWEGHKAAHNHANNGWQVVVSSADAVYFDFPYQADPKEHGYYWASRHTDSHKVFSLMPDNLPAMAEVYLDREDNPFTSDDSQPRTSSNPIHGLQGQLWSETIRTDAQVEYMIFPRMFALAERAWHKADWEVPYNFAGAVYNQDSGVFNTDLRARQHADWQNFSQLLGNNALARLDLFDIQYRIPTVGAQLKNGLLHINSPFPLPLQYRIDGGAWQDYQQPVAASGHIEVRALSANGQRAGRAQSL